jgi:signal transduction histidine kinase
MTPEEQLRITNETLYKHSHELAVKNKALSFLGKLYEISVLALSPRQLSEQVAFALQAEFDFEIVGLYRYDAIAHELIPFVAVTTDRIKALSNVSFNTIGFSDISKNNFFSSIIERKSMHYTELMETIWSDPALADTCRKIEAEKYVRSSLGYPLVIDGQLLGVALISMNRTYNDLTEYERDTLKTFTNVISVAINRAMLYEELSLANQRQESLIHFITHEVKGYLTKSKAVFASIVENDFPGTPDALHTLAIQALADVDRGVETVRDILDSSNLKKGTTEFAKNTFDLKTVVTEAVADFQKLAAEKNLALSLTVADGTYMYVGDAEKICRHVIRNLIDNSIKYTPAGSIAVHISQNSDTIVFSVTDTGVGINADDKKRLFTEGGKGKDSVRVNVDSTGYGLFIAKVVVDGHHGTIEAASEGPGKGSTFTVKLPTR